MKFIMKDKTLHFLFSFFITMTFAHFIAVVYAVIVTFFIGVAKEYHDMKSEHHNAEFLDIVANSCGIALATSLLFLFT